MENRKVMKLGRSTHVISLPKSWVELNSVKRGDILSLDMRKDGSLSIYPKIKEALQEITLEIDIGERKESFVRNIISCYLNGYSSIRLVSTKVFSMGQQRSVRDIAGKLYLRIIKADTREIIIQSLLDTSKIPLDTGMQRMHIIAASMFKDAMKALEQQDTKLAGVVFTLDDDVDHFSFLLLRMLRSVNLAEQVGLDHIDCLDYQTVIERIEHVADYAVDVANSVISLHGEQFPKFLLEPILEASREACGIFEEAIKAFFIKDLLSANKIIGLKDKVKKINREIIEMTLKEKRASIVCTTCLIRDSIRRIADCGSDIAIVTINRVIGRG